MFRATSLFLLMVVAGAVATAASASSRAQLKTSWPDIDLTATDLTPAKLNVYGPRNTIPPLNTPSFVPANFANHAGSLAPVILVELNGESKIYPLQIVATHSIINDELGGEPIAVTYCRICATSMVFKRKVDGVVTKMGFAGVSYEDNLVMFDEATETWWQQANGFGLAGPNMGAELEVVPSRLDSLEHAKEVAGASALVLGHSDRSRGRVLPPIDLRAPPTTPIVASLSPTDRVVVVEDKAYRLSDIAERGEVRDGDLILRHRPGRFAGPDAFLGSNSVDVGSVDVYRENELGRVSDQAYRINLGHALGKFSRGKIEFRDFRPIDDPYAPDRRVTRN